MANYSRRELLKKAAYAGPVIVTLPAVPSFAQTGSGGAIDCTGVFGPHPDGDVTQPRPILKPELVDVCFPSS